MSVIHEALKRKEDPAPAKPKAPPVSAPPRRAGLSRSWLIAAAAVWTALTALYWREFRERQTAQAKLQAALLQLNDTRAQAARDAEESARSARQMDAVSAKQREVEYDNFEKEKKIADLSREVHELRMKAASLPAGEAGVSSQA